MGEMLGERGLARLTSLLKHWASFACVAVPCCLLAPEYKYPDQASGLLILGSSDHVA